MMRVIIDFVKNVDGTYQLRLQAPPLHKLPLGDLHDGLCSILQGLGRRAIPRNEPQIITPLATDLQVLPQ
jgi:hypothetical protein